MTEENFYLGPVIEITKSPNFNFYDFEKKYNLVEETLHCLDEENVGTLGNENFILIENTARPLGAPTRINFGYGGSCKEIEKDKVEAALEWFNKYFKDDIESLKEELGHDRIRVYFGAVIYFN